MVLKEFFVIGLVRLLIVDAAILPPPWADPEKNPCASRPGGWLLVYWPSDGKCYRIFHRGYPCPETMELNPVSNSSKHSIKITGECRCPPRTARDSTSDVCYSINTKGPCGKGEYFAAVPQSSSDRKRIGHCVKAKQCNLDEVFWPATNQCFHKFTKGPCPEGQLLVPNEDSQFGDCQCSSTGLLSKYFWNLTKTCHEHFTKGPCQEKGELFLPGPTCGCLTTLPNYHPATDLCYEIGTTGPCKPGHRFEVEPPKTKASCLCKPGHVVWEDGKCYRLYTRGPCPPGEILFGNKTCSHNPCEKGKLFFPENSSCHKVGVQGPCPKGQLVLFEQSVRSSVEGISYRGTCGCSGLEKCGEEREQNPEILDIMGKSALNKIIKQERKSDKAIDREVATRLKICEKHENSSADNCHALYSRGPCSQGEWLVPARQGRAERQFHRFGGLDLDQPLPFSESAKVKARCECRQGFTKSSNGKGCHQPLVNLVKFLNGKDFFINSLPALKGVKGGLICKELTASSNPKRRGLPRATGRLKIRSLAKEIKYEFIDF